ncbi:MAG TPA: NADH-quinone oxidoreductase subunit NuoK [Candidatus Polarisedimenticolia bacterium]|nr:NADH-quinone oxidoreductase subunit NuoK [Candidatus Polarisedimenticolia bacterium]
MPPDHVLTVSLLLFGVGVLGVLTRRNAIIILMSIELMMNAANLNFVAFSRQHAHLTGQVFGVFTIAVAAGEVAVGLAIVLAVYRRFSSIHVDDVRLMKE